jgi:hypothetical protein
MSLPCPMHAIACAGETDDVIDAPKYDPKEKTPKDVIPCYDPATMQSLGYMPAMSESEVRAVMAWASLQGPGATWTCRAACFPLGWLPDCAPLLTG